MQNLPRQKLIELVTRDRSLCDDPRRCEALLKDLCGQHKREINGLVSALKEQIVAELQVSRDGVPATVLVARLTQRLQDSAGLAADLAHWSVESWALALGIFSPADLKTIKPPATASSTKTKIEDPFAASRPSAPAAANENTLRKAIRAALQQGEMTEQKQAGLNALRQRLDIPSQTASRIFQELAAEFEPKRTQARKPAPQAEQPFSTSVNPTAKKTPGTRITPPPRKPSVSKSVSAGSPRGTSSQRKRIAAVIALIIFIITFIAVYLPANVAWQIWRVRLYPNSDEMWGALGRAYQSDEQPDFAEACYAVARLLDRSDYKWRNRNPNLATAVRILRHLNVQDATLIGGLGDAALALANAEAAQKLYDLAVQHAPFSTTWRGKRDRLALQKKIQSITINYREGPAWGDLAEAYEPIDSELATACYAVAHLIQPSNRTWQEKAPDPTAAVRALRELRFPDEWIGDLGDAAKLRQQTAAAYALFRLAHELDPNDGEWTTKFRRFFEPQTQRVLSGLTNDETWGDLGDAYAIVDRELAESCYAVARLLDPADSEWSSKNPNLAAAVKILRHLDIRQDEWIGDLGDKARVIDPGAAHLLYFWAGEIDPRDEEWQRKLLETEM